MVGTVCGKYLSVCVHVTRRSPLGGKFGSVPSTLDKSAGTAPRAAKVIHCWLCSQRRHKRPVAHRVSFGSYVRVLRWSLSPCWVCKCSPGKDCCGWRLMVSGDFCLSAVLQCLRVVLSQGSGFRADAGDLCGC